MKIDEAAAGGSTASRVVRADFPRKPKAEPEGDRRLYNLDLEQALLGGLLLNNTALDDLGGLSSEHFYEQLHADIFTTVCKVIRSGKSATAISLRTYFPADPAFESGASVHQYLGTLVANATRTENLASYAADIRELSARRAAVITLEDATARAKNPEPDVSVSALLDGLTVGLDDLRLRADPQRQFGSLQIADKTPVDLISPYLAKGVLSRRDTAAIYGPFSSGKTFHALDFVWHIAQGKPWRGRRVTQAPALYIPLEGQAKFRNRLRAMAMEHGDTEGRLAWIDAPISLGRSELGDASESHIIREAKALERQCGEPVGVIVIDTLARALGGESENDADVVAAVMARIDRIKHATGAAVLLVGHPGKDQTKGLRGSYALPAGLDVVIHVERERQAAERTVTLEKARDGEEGPLGGFTLKPVHLGLDQDGEPVTSCVLVPTEPSKAAKPKMPKADSAADLALKELDHVLLAGGGKHVPHDRIPDGAECVTADAWRAACKRKGLSTGEPESERKAFNRAQKDLREAGLVDTLDGWVWRIRRDTSGTCETFAENDDNSRE